MQRYVEDRRQEFFLYMARHLRTSATLHPRGDATVWEGIGYGE
jgi:hypothetical protein